MEKLSKLQKRRIDAFIREDNLCDLVIYLNSLNNQRNLKTLQQSYEASKRYFWRRLKKQQKRQMDNIMGTAHMLFLDLDGAVNHFIDAQNPQALEQVLNLGLMYGRYKAVRSISEFGALNNHEQLVVGRKDYVDFLLEKVFPNIELQRDGNDFFVREDIMQSALNDLGLKPEALGDVAQKMYEEGSLDTPRKLLLSLYSGNRRLQGKAKDEFRKKSGRRKNIDAIVETICRQRDFNLVGQIQKGDTDNFYPLSANLYLVEKGGHRFVLKENIRYRIDFSCLDGYNMEQELYSESLKHEAIPGYFGTFVCNGVEFMMIEFVEGEQLTKYTTPDTLLAPEKAADIVMQLAKVLEYMHSQGIVYADMKDKNVMYDGEKVKLLDFGMASTRLYKENGNGGEFVHEVLSNAEYACPETIMMSRVYKQSDVFQLGIMFYKLLTGKHPFVDEAVTGRATEDYTERESELVAFSLANLWNNPNFDHPVFQENPGLASLCSDMLDKNYHRRPSAASVYQRLDFMEYGKQYDEKTQNDEKTQGNGKVQNDSKKLDDKQIDPIAESLREAVTQESLHIPMQKPTILTPKNTSVPIIVYKRLPEHLL